MRIYKFTMYVYLYSLLAFTLASVNKLNVQNFLRVPLINIRLIDMAIALIVCLTILDYLKRPFKKDYKWIFIIHLFILFYIILDGVLFVKTMGITDINTQFAWLAATFSIVAIIYLSKRKILFNIHSTLIDFASWGAVVITIITIAKLLALISGTAVIGDSGRVGLEVIGSKGIVSDTVLIPLVMAYGLFAFQLNLSKWKKVIFYISLVAIFIDLIMSFHRGFMFTVLMAILFFSIQSSKTSITTKLKSIFIISSILLVLIIGFSKVLDSLGYNPVKKITEVTNYAVDVENPAWSKGRYYVQSRILRTWLNKPWLGWGYDDVTKRAKVPSFSHNFLVTSLFYRGIIGTILLSIILMICFLNSIKLWKISSKLPYKEKILNRILVFVTMMWLIPLLTQEALTERYSATIQFIYFGIIIGLVNHYVYSNKTTTLNMGLNRLIAQDKIIN